ncbi:MAG: pyridoxamine 5'-phosphate oxidase family protein [Rhodopila sp.]|nr:pyridoxamine 5'-phosphate oxidase family protein [Rhodopila sp.]
MSETLFHPGELAAQVRAGVSTPSAAIRDWMPDQHRSFFGLLPFLAVGTAGLDGAPVATILTGSAGFISSPDPTTLHIAARPDGADPASAFLVDGAPVGLLGIDLATRRRNRANGTIRSSGADGLTVSVSQSFGNCQQYIQTRLWQDAAPDPGPVTHLAGLDPAARSMIAAADTFFVATASGGGAGSRGGMDISHRGGRPGFVAVEADTLTVPDFRGNRYFNTLGNLILDPRAALLFVDWTDGTVLQLQGRAEILWNDNGGFAGAERLWRVQVTSGWRRPRALPLRWSFQEYARQTQQTGSWTEAARIRPSDAR